MKLTLKHYILLILVLVVFVISGCAVTNFTNKNNVKSEEITSPLLLDLKFDDLKDSSDYNNLIEGNGVLISNSTAIFDGSNYLKIYKDFNKNKDLTIAFWINPTKRQNGFILSNGPNDKTPTFSVYFDSFKRIKIHRGKESIYTESNTILFNTWSHVIITSNGELTTVYINGEKVKQLQQFVRSDENETETFIGKGYECSQISSSYRCADSFFDGKLDDLKIYNKVLDDTEITELYKENKKL